MRFAWSTAKKDWRRQLRDPAGLAMWIGLPLLVGLLMTMASGGADGPEPRAHLLVADQDDSFLSNLLLGALSQDAAGGFVNAESVTEEEGRRRIGRGEASAFLLIPDGFMDGVMQEEPVTLLLLKNPAESILPAIVEEGLSILTEGTFYLQRVVGDEMRAIVDGPDSTAEDTDAFVSDIAVRINQAVQRVGTTLFPPVIALEVTTGGDDAPVAAGDSGAQTEGAPGGPETGSAPTPAVETSVALFFLPGLLFMSMLFMAQGLAQDLWKERTQHTLRRIVVSPRPVAAFLSGKVLGAAGLMLLVGTIALSVAYAYFRLPVQTLPLAIVWSVFSGIVLFVMLAVIVLHASSERAAGVLATALLFPLMMLGGSFFPFEAMPEGMAAIGRLTPNGWALEQLKAILTDRVDAVRLAVSFAGLVGVGFLLFLWSARRLRRGFAQGG